MDGHGAVLRSGVGETLLDALDATRRANGEADALRFNGQSITYDELGLLTDRCASALASSGVVEGDRIAVLAPPCWQHVVLFFAAAKLCALFVGLNPRHRAAEHHDVLADCTPKMLFACDPLLGRPSGELVNELVEHHGSIVNVVRLLGSGRPDTSFEAFLQGGLGPVPPSFATPRSGVAIVYTSGSTGRRKGAVLDHEGLLASFRGMLDRLPLMAPVNCLNDLPIDHLGGLVERVLPAVLTGGHVVLHERFEPSACLRDAARHRVNYLQGEVTQWLRCVDAPEFVSIDLSCVEVALFTGAAAPQRLIHKLCAKFPVVTTAWGMTETHSGVTFTPKLVPGSYEPGLVGRAVESAQIRIGASENQGEVFVRGPVVIGGYFGLPPGELKVDADGWLHTGDIGVLENDGSLRLVGRATDMYKSGGYNVYPREVEAALEAHLAVTHAVVVSVPDATYQEAGFAFVVADGATTGEDLRAHCSGRLARYKVPRYVELTQVFPLLPNGKVDRRALREVALKRLGLSIRA